MRVLIAIGYLTGHGYWFWNFNTGQLYWNRHQNNRVFGGPRQAVTGTYNSLFSSALWEEDDRVVVRKTVELARQHRQVFRHQFCIKDATTGEKVIIDAVGRWLFDENGEPWAMWGWNHRMVLKGGEFDVKEAKLQIRKRLDRWQEIDYIPGGTAALLTVLTQCSHVHRQ